MIRSEVVLFVLCLFVLQHWYKDEKYGTRVKDEEGFPCFALVNKATGQAMKHSVGDTHPVRILVFKVHS